MRSCTSIVCGFSAEKVLGKDGCFLQRFDLGMSKSSSIVGTTLSTLSRRMMWLSAKATGAGDWLASEDKEQRRGLLRNIIWYSMCHYKTVNQNTDSVSQESHHSSFIVSCWHTVPYGNVIPINSDCQVPEGGRYLRLKITRTLTQTRSRSCSTKTSWLSMPTPRKEWFPTCQLAVAEPCSLSQD